MAISSSRVTPQDICAALIQCCAARVPQGMSQQTLREQQQQCTAQHAAKTGILGNHTGKCRQIMLTRRTPESYSPHSTGHSTHSTPFPCTTLNNTLNHLVTFMRGTTCSHCTDSADCTRGAPQPQPTIVGSEGCGVAHTAVAKKSQTTTTCAVHEAANSPGQLHCSQGLGFRRCTGQHCSSCQVLQRRPQSSCCPCRC